MRLNLGCGSNILNGWVNRDQDLDITSPLPFLNDCVEAIFIEHCLEHVTIHQAFSFMEECHRILINDGYLRITVPSIVRAYKNSTDEYVDFAANNFGAERTKNGAVKKLIFGHGHLSVWDISLLKTCLLAAGFSKADEAQLYHSPYGCLEGHHKVIGEAFNDIESISVEARK